MVMRAYVRSGLTARQSIGYLWSNDDRAPGELNLPGHLVVARGRIRSGQILSRAPW